MPLTYGTRMFASSAVIVLGLLAMSGAGTIGAANVGWLALGALVIQALLATLAATLWKRSPATIHAAPMLNRSDASGVMRMDSDKG